MKFRARISGFTLIELLVVMVLLGVLTSIATTSIGGNQVRELEIETNRLHALLRAAANESVFTNTEIGVMVAEDEYAFIVYDEEAQEWQTAQGELLKPGVLPEWMFMEFEREGEIVEIPKSESQEDTREYDSDAKETKPDFMFLSSGEITNFTLRLSIKEDLDQFREIKLNQYGEVILPHIEERES